ncbi:protein spire isoform X2 [Bemisia tabaci]|uniref:protein spire isoform X2 n=1 Tax=Bemisia tabaci TaxID=7038 RepID=UPI003B287824
MAGDVQVRPKKCKLDPNKCVSLSDILISFNAPISEEHAWALCYQCAKCFKQGWESDRDKCKLVSELDHVLIHQDGHVHSNTIFAGGGTHNEGPPGGSSSERRIRVPSEQKLVASLGIIIFRALDHRFDDEEERRLSPDLESLITNVTAYDLGERGLAETDDEGIERDAGECDDEIPNGGWTLNRILDYCASHVCATNSQQADSHYQAVCRALVAEALELSSFLEKVSQGTTDLRQKAAAITAADDIDSLKFSDWARLWVQVIRELRHGVKLKKVSYSRTPIEYELTPYEILMDDIRSRRYKLNKVMVDGNIPHRVRKDAHAIILEFIRSRPPLKKASERVYTPKQRIPQASTPREILLDSIKRGDVKLRPLSEFRKIKKFDRDSPVKRDSSSNEKETQEQQKRRLIKVDFSVLNDSDNDDDTEDLSEDPRTEAPENEESSKSSVWHRRTGTRTLNAQTAYQRYMDSALESYDLATQCPSRRSMRRHTIVVCDPVNSNGSLSVPHTRPSSCTRSNTNSPTQEDSLATILPEISWSRSSLQEDLLQTKQWQEECLSVTLEEFVHIRSVLTKAELESLPVENHVKEDAEKGKVCFLCMKTRFSIFGPWGQICKLCKRNVCAKCYTKMRIPTEHFSHVPVVALSPQLVSPNESSNDDSLMNRLGLLDLKPLSVGSAPCSPKLSRSNQTKSVDVENGPQSLPPTNPKSLDREQKTILSGSKTLGRKSGKADKVRGLQMTVCHDCKTMVILIIKSSRTSRNSLLKQLKLDLALVY